MQVQVVRDVVSSCIPFILQSKGVELMKWTKQAGLVSCNFEAQLINKINNDLEREKAKKSKHIKATNEKK